MSDAKLFRRASSISSSSSSSLHAPSATPSGTPSSHPTLVHPSASGRHSGTPSSASLAPPSSPSSDASPSRSSLTHRHSSLAYFLVLSPLLLLLLLFASPASCGPAEDRLIATVLKGYNPLARPVEGEEAVDVWFGMGLIQILQIIEVEQTVKANVWLRLVWYDTRLTWDEAEYDGVPNIRLPFDSVWNPEIVLFNNANGVYEVNYKSNVVVYPYGLVLWVPPALFVSSCSIDVRYFPFDEQKCEMIFGSWTYNSDQVRLLWYDGFSETSSNPYAVMGDYARSGSWDVTLVPGVIKTDAERKVTNTVFYLHLRRKTLFFIINLIIPCVVIAILCWFTFLLPSTSGEKVGYAITLLLGLMVFLLLLFTVLPATSESVPLMAQFLLFIYIVNVVTIILCVWIIGYSFRLPSTHFMSDGVRALFLDLLPPLIRMRRPEGEPHVHEPRFNLDESIKAEEMRAAAVTAAAAGGRGGMGAGSGVGNVMTSSGHSMDGRGAAMMGGGGGGGRGGFGSGFENLVNRKYGVGGGGFGAASNVLAAGGINNPGNSGGNNNNNPSSALSQPLSDDVIQAAKDVRYIAERASSNNEDDQVAGDWTYIGLVLDSFTFWVTGIVIVGGTAYFLMSAPNSFGSVDQMDLIDNWDANHCRIFFGGDYKLFSYATADTVTIDTMRALCCAHFFSPTFAEKTSKYSNETAPQDEIDRMKVLCDKDKRRKRRHLAGEEWKEEEEEEEEEEKEEKEEMRFVPGVRGGGGGMKIPASAEAHRKRREKVRAKYGSGTGSGSFGGSGSFSGSGSGGSADWEAKFREMGLDFETEWKKALKENLVLMRDGEAEMRKVDDLAKKKPRMGLRHNATNVG